MRILLIIFFLLLLYSCKSHAPESSSVDSDKFLKNHYEEHDTAMFFEINYENVLKNMKVIPLSQVASNVEYIKLETNKDCMIRRIRGCYFTDSLIFINNIDHILKFSKNGKFLQRIGITGRGPGEIDRINTMSIIPDKKIIAVQKSAIQEMLYFSFDGEVIKTIKIPNATHIKAMNDGRFIVYNNGVWGSNKYTFSLIEETGDTVSAIKNYCTWKNTSGGVLSIGGWPEPFTSMNHWFLKDKYNDTVYTIDSDRIVPSYSVNLGKFKLPDEIRPERLDLDKMQLYKEKALNYYYIHLFEMSRKLFIVSYCYSSKGGGIKYLLYDKAERMGIQLHNGGNISTGFVNDMDGGMNFWPVGIANDNQVYMPINIMNLKEELDKAKIDDKTIKYPKKQQDLEKILFDSDISDNPILMIVTLKSR